jgi:dephospho-CoA kinase
MKIVGLTGSIGMGKSTTASLFKEQGVPVYDADAAVHEIYGKGGAAVELVGDAFPGVVVDGAIDRARLGAQVLGAPEALKTLEGIVHPLLGQHRRRFFEQTEVDGVDLVVLDVPLLFETGGDRGLDAVIVVSAPEHVQRERVLARPGMSLEKLEAILARQLPDKEKRARADIVIDTSQGVEDARRQVVEALSRIRHPDWRSTRPS